MSPMEQYIRAYSASIGLNPDIVMRVVLSEGGRSSLTSDPTRQSLIGGTGAGQEQSYGPFQMNMSPGALGDRALKAGFDPRDPAASYQVAKFAMDAMKNEGLGAWHGWKGDQWAARAGAGTGADVPIPAGAQSRASYPRGSIDEARQDTPSYARPSGADLGPSPYSLPTADTYGGPGEGAGHFGGTGLGEPGTAENPLITKNYENPFEKAGAAVAKMGGRKNMDPLGVIQPTANPPLSQLPSQPTIDPSSGQAARQALAMALMRLNSGQLWPSGAGGGQFG